MAKQYRIKPGASFRDGDTVKTGGDHIELDLDMARLHRDKIEDVEPPEIEPVQTSAPAPDSEG
ncbi:MAG: hypothetical protein ABFD96_07145 [Armatimonadia bacterium]